MNLNIFEVLFFGGWVGGGGSSSGVGLKWMPITVGQRHK